MVKLLSSYTPDVKRLPDGRTSRERETIDITALAVQRAKDRRMEAEKKRAFGFQGANITRLNQDWWRSPQSADSELRYALRNLRFRCRELERNNDWFRKLLSLFEDNVVSSTGIKLQMKIYDMVTNPATKEMVRQLDSRSCELIEAAWQEQCKTENYTVTRKLSDIAADKLVMRSIVRDGDILVRKVRGYSNKFRYSTQILEADYLDDFYIDSFTLANGNQVRMGVEVDAWKCPVAYWMLVGHPGDFAFGIENQAERIRIEADEIIHPYVIERPEQSRGYPWAVAAMNRLNMLGGYEEAELVAARLAACKGGFYETDRPQMGQMDGGYAGQETDQRVPMETMEPGINETLPIGMKFKPNDPQHPHSNFPAFSKQQLRAVASSVGVAYVSLANDLEGVNFSSIRAGLLDERETYKGVQTFYIQDVKNQVFEDWLEWVLLNGFLGITLRPKDFQRLNQKQFKARRWDWVDPLKDINAAVTAIEAGLDTRSNVIANKGGDYEDVMTELVYEKDYQEEQGLDFSGAQPAADKGEFPDDEKGGGDDDLKKTKELQALLMGRKKRWGGELDAMGAKLLVRVEKILERLEKKDEGIAEIKELIRLNPNHGEQPRHPQTGQWVEAEALKETEDKVDSLLKLVQEMMAKAAKPVADISGDAKPLVDLLNVDDVRGMIDSSIRNIDLANIAWTPELTASHAKAIIANGRKADPDADGHWVTIEGEHIFIGKGETVGEALKEKEAHESNNKKPNGGKGPDKEPDEKEPAKPSEEKPKEKEDGTAKEKEPDSKQESFKPVKAAKLEELTKDWKQSLDNKQINGIKGYAGTSDSFEINKAFRTGEKLEGTQKELAERLRATLDKADFPANTTTYRALSGPAADKFFDQAKESIGGEIQDKGFVSTTTEAHYAQGWGERFAPASNPKQITICEVQVGKGSKAAYLDSIPSGKSEHEVLLQAGSRFKVISAREEGGQKRVTLRLI